MLALRKMKININGKEYEVNMLTGEVLPEDDIGLTDEDIVYLYINGKTKISYS
jgi:hypothetical protein